MRKDRYGHSTRKQIKEYHDSFELTSIDECLAFGFFYFSVIFVFIVIYVALYSLFKILQYIRYYTHKMKSK